MKDLEKDIFNHLKERGWHNLRPADLAKSIVIESGELLEHFQWENKSLQEVRSNKVKLAEISKELADVLIYALDMSVLLEFDTEKIIREKLEHVKKKYPADLMRKSAKKGSGEDSEYWKIKRKYRKEGK